jgi:pimeloyl-ACP methyl ester carboxylesterase
LINVDMSGIEPSSPSAATTGPPARDSQTFTLSSGDIVGYAEYGLETGTPIFYCHGWPGSRLEGALCHDAAVAASVRLIALDRPGIGLSSFKEGRRFLDWPGTLSELAQYLGIQEFSVVGMSGGTPYALACAKTMPRTQLRKVGIVAGRGPPWMGTRGMSFSVGASLYVYTWLPFFLRPFLDWTFMDAVRNPDPNAFREVVLKGLDTMSEPDRVFLKDGRNATMVVEAFREAFRQGSSEGIAYDGRLLGNWDFDIHDIDAEVKLWYGDKDLNCPVGMGKKIAETLKHGELTVFPGEGHVTGLAKYGEEIFRELSQN